MDEHGKEKSCNNWEWFTDFCGIMMPSNYYTFHVFSRLLKDNPQIKQIVEIGTHTGSMAVYLALEAFKHRISFTTFDIQKQVTTDTDRILDHLGAIQKECNVFEQENRQEIFDMIKRKPTLLLCDGGLKRDEAEMCTPHLHSGSVLLIHDWGIECKEEDMGPVYAHGRLEPIDKDEWNKNNVRLARFKVK